MTAEQAALLEKAKSSLDASVLLLERDFYDFAASRAYYVMFYVAEAILLGEGLTFSKHSAVIRRPMKKARHLENDHSPLEKGRAAARSASPTGRSLKKRRQGV